MSLPGIGAMIHKLSGGSDEDPNKYIHKKISEAIFSNDEFILKFEDGINIKITDEGQSCCENRYMTCDDDVSQLNGKTLRSIEVKNFESKDGASECHEICFLEITTNEGVIVTFATHNEHNGYYGGFALNIKEFNKR